MPASDSSDGDARVRRLRERDFIVQRALFCCAGVFPREFREGASFFGGLVRFRPSSRLRHAGGGVPDAEPASNSSISARTMFEIGDLSLETRL